MENRQIFISYSGRDEVEASLLQYALETLLVAEGVTAWSYQRDQSRSEKEIARTLKDRVRDSAAVVFLVSPETLETGATQWMELAYADAFEVKTFILLHHLEFGDLKQRGKGVPPLLLSSQCSAAVEWKVVVEAIRALLKEGKENG